MTDNDLYTVHLDRETYDLLQSMITKLDEDKAATVVFTNAEVIHLALQLMIDMAIACQHSETIAGIYGTLSQMIMYRILAERDSDL
jgi:hypothetical protein